MPEQLRRRAAITCVGLVLTFVIANSNQAAELQVFPGPEGLSPSPHYRVEVSSSDLSFQESFVYCVDSQWKTNNHATASWTTVASNREIQVRVTPLKRQVNSCRILPSSYGVSPALENNSAVFTMRPKQKVSVEFDGDLLNPLVIFVDEPHSVPQDKRVRYFGPGVHDIGWIRPKPHETIYLAGGAYVHARIEGQSAPGVQVRGPGVLSGEKFANLDDQGRKTPHLIDFETDCPGVLIDGPTVVNSPHFCIVAGGDKSTVRNTKMISWWFSTDGVGTGSNGTVENCFFMVNDDSIKLYRSGMKVRDCVIWQLENGAPFQFTWNMPGRQHGFDVRNVDVIRVEHEWHNDNEAVFDSIHGGSGNMSGYYFEDIRIENCDWRLISLQIKRNKFSRARTLGSISDVVLKNVSVQGNLQQPSQILSLEPGSAISDVTFENLRINGRLINSAKDMNLEIDPDTAKNVRFITSGHERESLRAGE